MTGMQRIKRELANLRDLAYYRLKFSARTRESIINHFHRLYYDSHLLGKTWMNTYWMGVPLQKCPTDLWVYQEIAYELKPDVIVETGTFAGGSALYLACLCDLVGNGRVISIDIDNEQELLSGQEPMPSKARPSHPRITYLRGSSTSEAIVRQVKERIESDRRVLVMLDSDHRKAHVLNEMRIYAPLVSTGSYLIVEDTNINGHPVLPGLGPGPREAVEEFLKENHDFKIDESRENHLLTFSPGGYLKGGSDRQLNAVF